MILKNISKLWSYIILAAASLVGSTNGEEFKINETIDKKVSINFTYSEQYHPEAVDDWDIIAFKPKNRDSILFNYREGKIPDNIQNLGWSSLESKASDENTVTEILQSLKEPDLSYNDFIKKAETFSHNQKRLLLSSLGDLGGRAYGGKSSGQNNAHFLEKLQQQTIGENVDIGLCGAIHKNLAGIFNDINGSEKISLIGGVGYNSLHAYMAELGKNGWNIINYSNIIFTKEKNLTRALLAADEQTDQFAATHQIFDEDGEFLFTEITQDGKNFFNSIGKDPENDVFKTILQTPLPTTGIELNIGNYISSINCDYRVDENDVLGFIGAKVTNMKCINKSIDKINTFNLHFGIHSNQRKEILFGCVTNFSISDIKLKEDEKILFPLGALVSVGYKSYINGKKPLTIFCGIDSNSDLPTSGESIFGSEEVNDAMIHYAKPFLGGKYKIPTIGNENLELLLSQELSILGDLVNEPIIVPSKTTIGFDAHAFNGYCYFGGLLKLEYTGAGFKPSLNLDFERNGFNVILGGNILIPNEKLIIPATTNFNASVQVQILDNLNLKFGSSLTLDDKETTETNLGLEYRF